MTTSQLITKAKKGDQAAIEQIVADYKPLIRTLANKFYLVGGDKDDLLQEGMLGLYYAINDYDEAKGAFPAFVKLCVARQITDAVHRDGSVRNKPLCNYVDIDSAAQELQSDDNPLQDLLVKEYAEKVAQVISTKLTRREKQVITLFSQGYSYEDISQRLGTSYKAVDGALQRARKKLFEIKE